MDNLDCEEWGLSIHQHAENMSVALISGQERAWQCSCARVTALMPGHELKGCWQSSMHPPVAGSAALELCHVSALMAWTHLDQAIGPVKCLHHVGVCQVLSQGEFHQGLCVLSLVWGHRSLNDLQTNCPKAGGICLKGWAASQAACSATVSQQADPHSEASLLTLTATVMLRQVPRNTCSI